MPDAPNTPQSSQQIGSGWYNPPSADIDLDSMFPNPELPQATPQAQQPEPQAQPEPFLKASSGTVYMSAEEAAKGVAEKDRLIAEQKAKLKAFEEAKAQQTRPPDNRPVSYRESPEKYFEDLVTAANSGDKRKYAQTQAQFLAETLAPYAPVLSEMTHEKAVRELERTTPGTRAFLESGEFQATLEREPVLAQAIEYARQNPEAAQQLAALYRLAFFENAGHKMPEIVRSAAQQQQTPPQPTRPTLQSSTPTLTPTGLPVGTPSLNTPEGRKAIIERAQQRGITGQDWTPLGL